LLVYEAGKCKGCGVDVTVASDPNMSWDVHEHVCYSCRAVQVMTRTVQKQHSSEPKPGVPHPLDGRVLFVEPYYHA
jgi:hypothetical protein